MGRRVFWLCVGTVGFIYGYDLAVMFFQEESSWVVWAIACVIGLLGVGMAFFLQKAAIGFLGFAAGGYLAFRIAGFYSSVDEKALILSVLLGGLIGLIFMHFFFGGTLVFLTSAIGAFLLLEFFGVNPLSLWPVFLALTLAGVVMQLRVSGARSNPKVSSSQ